MFVRVSVVVNPAESPDYMHSDFIPWKLKVGFQNLRPACDSEEHAAPVRVLDLKSYLFVQSLTQRGRDHREHVGVVQFGHPDRSTLILQSHELGVAKLLREGVRVQRLEVFFYSYWGDQLPYSVELLLHVFTNFLSHLFQSQKMLSLASLFLVKEGFERVVH